MIVVACKVKRFWESHRRETGAQANHYHLGTMGDVKTMTVASRLPGRSLSAQRHVLQDSILPLVQILIGDEVKSAFGNQ